MNLLVVILLSSTLGTGILRAAVDPAGRAVELIEMCFAGNTGVRTLYTVEGPWLQQVAEPPADASGLEAAMALGAVSAGRREGVAVVDHPRLLLRTAANEVNPALTWFWSGEKSYVFGDDGEANEPAPVQMARPVVAIDRRLPPDPDNQRFLFAFLLDDRLTSEPSLLTGRLVDQMRAGGNLELDEQADRITIRFVVGESDVRLRVERRWTIVIRTEPTPRLLELRLEVVGRDLSEARGGDPVLQSRTIATIGAWDERSGIAYPRQMVVMRAARAGIAGGGSRWYVEHQRYERSSTEPASLATDEILRRIPAHAPVRVFDMSLGIRYTIGEAWVRVGRDRHELDAPIQEVISGAAWMELAQRLDVR